MFKNIQKQLLLKYPLLWNTKFIPMLIIGVVLNIIYFLIGYYDGTIDFTGEYIYGDNDDAVLGFGFLISAIILLLWFWFYSKNNSFKTFYVKSKNAQFYEFIQILSIFILFFNFYIVYKIGEQYHNRSYYSYEEAKRRCEIIGLADIFIDGSFESTDLDSIKMGLIYKDKAKNDSVHEERRIDNKVFYKDYIYFDGKKYDEFSLINRNSRRFEINLYNEDSINQTKLKKNIINNKNETINFLSSYLKIIKEHNLNTNLTANLWYNRVVREPGFNSFDLIFPYTYEVESQKNKNYYINHNYDTYYYDEVVNQNYRIEDKYIWREDYLNDRDKRYSKYFVEHHLLKDKYGIISNAYSYRYFRLNELLTLNCVAFMFAIFVFSFRISKLKKWFISIVIFGVLAILYGILANVLRNADVLFPGFSILTFIVFWFYLFIIIKNKNRKKFSEIVLNICIWSLPMLMPFLYLFAQEFYRDYIFVFIPNMKDPIIKAFRDYVSIMFAVNFIVSIILMFFVSRIIRTWKGIPEE